MGNEQSVKLLTDKEVEMLVKTSGKTEDTIRQWYNDFYEDSNRTNRMNKRQFQKFYTKLRHNPRLEQITDHIFRAFDSNQSGTIDFNEFLIGYITTTEGTSRQKFEYSFEVYDINDDQLIDKREAKKILNSICRILGMTDEDAQTYTTTLMLSFDTNQDKVLTKTEFINGCLHDPTLGKLSNPFQI